MNIDLKGLFIMVKVNGQLISLMIESKYSLKERQHLYERGGKKGIREKNKNTTHYILQDKHSRVYITRFNV